MRRSVSILNSHYVQQRMPFYDPHLEKKCCKNAPRRYLRFVRVADLSQTRNIPTCGYSDSPKVLSRILLYMMALDFLCTIRCVIA